MPCNCDGMDEHYNQLEYGIHASSADIAAMVACELGSIVDKLCHGANCKVDLMSPMARKWYEKHKEQDNAGKV